MESYNTAASDYLVNNAKFPHPLLIILPYQDEGALMPATGVAARLTAPLGGKRQGQKKHVW
jgi:hypothetical protein